MLGAATLALSAGEASRMRAGRDGSVTRRCLRMMSSISFRRAW